MQKEKGTQVAKALGRKTGLQAAERTKSTEGEKSIKGVVLQRRLKGSVGKD